MDTEIIRAEWLREGRKYISDRPGWLWLTVKEVTITNRHVTIRSVNGFGENVTERYTREYLLYRFV